ncbi:unnamed protein product [Trichobilharzia regenti]|nr:unnamed protein product [Trichobilharzia regenti]
MSIKSFRRPVDEHMHRRGVCMRRVSVWEGKLMIMCIYTPPSCGHKQLHVNPASSSNSSRIISSESLFGDLKSTPVNQKPISILKVSLLSLSIPMLFLNFL